MNGCLVRCVFGTMSTEHKFSAVSLRDLLRLDHAQGRSALDEALGKPSTPLHAVALRALLACNERGFPLVDRAGVYIDGSGAPVLEDLVSAGLAAHGPDEEGEGFELQEVYLTPDTSCHVSVKCVVALPSYVAV